MASITLMWSLRPSPWSVFAKLVTVSVPPPIAIIALSPVTIQFELLSYLSTTPSFFPSPLLLIFIFSSVLNISSVSWIFLRCLEYFSSVLNNSPVFLWKTWMLEWSYVTIQMKSQFNWDQAKHLAGPVLATASCWETCHWHRHIAMLYFSVLLMLKYRW